MTDRQLDRFAAARSTHHSALEALRMAQHEADRAAAELATAGSALAERVRLLDVTNAADGRG